jgi:molybdopterin synthase sulfur carrier subunit
MGVEVKIPTIMRRHTAGQAVLTGEGGTVRDVLQKLEERFPGLTKNVVTDEGDLHRFVNVYVNNEDVRYLGSLETEVKDGDVLSILPAVAGGRSFG